MDTLADPTRLRLLRLLERHELGVVEFCDVLQLPQSTVSRHLKVLSDLGWARSRREGTTNLYCLDELDVAPRKLWQLAREQTNDWVTVQQDEMRLARRLRDKKNDSQSFFAGAAAQWDKMRAELYGTRFATTAMLALLPADTVVADLGCGTGPLTADLAAHVKQVIAVDNSAAMLKAAHKRVAGAANVDLRRGDLESLPIQDGVCDAAVMVLALTYVADPARVLREIARVLKPGGKVAIVDLLPHDRDDFRRQMEQRHAGFEPALMTRQLKQSGFAHAKCTPLPPETNVKGPSLFLATGKQDVT
jgi:ArsR family transcriptional regulator